MRGWTVAIGGFSVAWALACGGSAPEPADTGAEPAATVTGVARPAAPRPAAKATAVAPAPTPEGDGKTKVDLSHGDLSITTKKGTQIELQNNGLLGGGLSIQGAKTDISLGRVKREGDTDEPEKKKLFGK